MRIKKILSLAVVLAMVLTVVPMFGLVASAEEVTPDGYTVAFNGSREGENAQQIGTGWATNADLSTVWEGWTTSTDNNQATVNGQGYSVNGVDRNCIQFYRTELGQNEQGHGTTNNTVLTVNTPGYAENANNMIIRWYFKRSLNVGAEGDNYCSMVFKDTEDRTIASIFMDKNDNTIASGRPFGWPDEGALLEVKYLKNTQNGNYDVVYLVDGVKTWKETVDEVNGFGSIECTLGSYNSRYNHVALADLMIYESAAPEATSKATVLDAIDATFAGDIAVSKFDLPTSINDGFTDYDVKWASEPEIISEDGTVTATVDDVTAIKITPSIEFSGETVTGASQIVTVLPGSLKGKYDTGEAVYTIDAEPVIALANLKDGENTTSLSDSQGWDHITVNDVTYHTTKANGGSSNASSARGEFTVDADTDYLAAITYKNYGANAFIKSEYSWDNGTIVTFPGTTGWKRDVIKFNSGDKTTLYFMTAWLSANSSTIQNFEVYKLTEDDDWLESLDEGTTATVIEGNKPVLPATLNGTSKNEEPMENQAVVWDIDSADLTFDPDNPTVTVTGHSVDRPTVTATANVTVLACTDDSLANQEIKSYGKSSGDINAAHTFGEVKGKVSFEFDVVYKVAPGNNDLIAIGDSSISSGKPSFGSEAFALQGNNTGKAGFRGNPDTWTDLFNVTLNNPYRVFTTMYLDGNPENDENPEVGTYDVTVTDAKTGEVVFSDTNITYRNANTKKLDTLYTIYNAGGEGANCDRFAVTNFRISWAEAANYQPVTINYMSGEQVVGTSVTENKYAVGDEITVSRTVIAPQYSLDVDTTATVEADEQEDGKLIAKVPVNALDKFTWDPRGEANVAAYNGDLKSYNVATVITWDGSGAADGRESYAYVTVPAKSDNQQYAIKVTGYFNNGIDNSNGESQSNAPGVNISLVNDEAALRAIDLTTGATANEGLNALELTNIAEKFILMPNDFDAESKIGTVYIPVSDEVSMTEGAAALKMYATRRGNCAIKEISVEAVDVPEAPVASLGWDGSAFTANFALAEADTVTGFNVKVTGDESVNKDYALGEEETGIAVSTDKTNAILEVAAVNNGVAGPSVKASIYSLVMKAVGTFDSENGDTIAQAQLDAVNKVLKDGGLYVKNVDGQYSLTDEVKDVLTITQPGDDNLATIIISDNAAKAGLKFVQDTLPGSSAGDVTFVDEKTVKVNVAGAGIAEAETLSLDTVYLEFLPSEVVEVESGEASGEIVLTEEL